jgi:hypothetical protein
VYRLQLLLALAITVIFGSESRGTRDRILLSQIRDFFFVAFYDSQGYGGSIRTRLHTGNCHLSQFFSLYSVGAVPQRNTVYYRMLTVSTAIYLRHPATGCLPRICCPSNGVVTLFCLRGNVFTELLPSNGRLLLLHYSGFRVSCHNMIIQ